MCVYSMVMDHYDDEWRRRSEEYRRQREDWQRQWNPYAPTSPAPAPLPPASPITPQEVDEFRRLLERAREYDRKNSEPDCEMEEKRQKLRKLAEELGVKIDFV